MRKLFLTGGVFLLAMGLAVNSGAAEGEKGVAPRGGMYKHEGGCGCVGAHGPMLFKKLGLDEKQKEALRDIRLRTMKETVKKKADLKLAKIELMQILSKDPIDMAAVGAAVKKIEGLKADMKMTRIKEFEEIKSNLNAEQKKQFTSVVVHMMMKRQMMRRCGCHMHGKHMHGHGHMHGNPMHGHGKDMQGKDMHN